MLYGLDVLRTRRLGDVPQVAEDGAPARQAVQMAQRWHFARACPAHLEALGGIDGYWCPHGKSGHSILPTVEDLPGTSEGWSSFLLWVVIAISAERVRVAGRVYGSGRVEWASWFLNRYPDAVQQVGGRDEEGFIAGLRANAVPGFKQLWQRLREKGMTREAARREAERQALARLAVEMDSQRGAA